MLQDLLLTNLPSGGHEMLINHESLLLDDMYVLAPMAYALRMQHLEESLGMADRLEAAVRGTMKPQATMVKHHKVKEALADDPDFELLVPEDYAKAFNTSPAELKP